MVTDEAGDEAVRARLVHLAGHPDHGPTRRAAQGSAITAYSAAHGHPLDHPDPSGVPARRRWAVRTRAAVAGGAVLVALTGVVVVRGLGQVPSIMVDRDGVSAAVEAADDLTPGGDVPAGGSAGSGPDPRTEGSPADDRDAAQEVVVHVVGQVATPGVVRLPDGARVADAVEAAGGVTAEADLTGVNLARIVVDGEQVVVPLPGEVVAQPGGPGGSGGSADGGVVDLNTADAVALEALPGVGPVLADRIIAWRTEHGPFTSVDELGEVSGIGPAILADLRDLVRA